MLGASPKSVHSPFTVCGRLSLFVVAAAVLPAVPLWGQAADVPSVQAPDGVAVDPEGRPFYSTFSLCALDPGTGELGVAVTTRVPFVGRAVPWVRAGVGAVATQAWTVVEYGVQGLDLMESGVAPADALEQLLADDDARELRQLGLLDAQGRTAAHSGSGNGDWAGSRQGPNYTVQGNILVGPEVVDAVADHFEGTEGLGMPLAERMIAAMAAGQAKGGDSRWGRRQSAAIRIADPNNSGRGGDHISLAIDVGEHETPVAEMMRIYRTTAERLGYRSFSEIAGRDVVELKEKLHALGYWRPDGDGVPAPPAWDVDSNLRASDPDAFEKAVADFRARQAAYRAEHATFNPELRDAVDAFRAAQDLEYAGNPRGLVDARFVERLNGAYAEHLRSKTP
ncbi:MAG: DUF1028 domain-containing protein [Acidobacteriota bacterium]